MKSQLWLVSIMVASFGASALADDQTKAPTPSSPAPAAPTRRTVQVPANSALAPQLNEVARLSEAGVNENVILTYIDRSPGVALTANDVVTLHDRGVSLTIITAMLQHPPVANLAHAPTPPASPAVATLTLSKGSNLPIVYPTPATEAVPLMDRVVVAYPTAAAYGYPSVSVWGSSYVTSSYPGCRNFAGVQAYGAACRTYACDSSYRCR